jgi:putative phosphoribosyl transferase
MFEDRTQAGRLLAQRLQEYAGRADVIVLGAPRGGVPVAFEVATALHVPLDVFVLRKLGVPGREELAFGAIASGGVRVLDYEIIDALEIPNSVVERVTQMEKQELVRREQTYRAGRKPLDVAGRTVILVDDGIATGASVAAGIGALRQMKPGRLVVAVPVAPESTARRLRKIADEIVCLETPGMFYGVGQFYADFSQVSDDEVRNLIDRAGAASTGQRREISGTE